MLGCLPTRDCFRRIYQKEVPFFLPCVHGYGSLQSTYVPNLKKYIKENIWRWRNASSRK